MSSSQSGWVLISRLTTSKSGLASAEVLRTTKGQRRLTTILDFIDRDRVLWDRLHLRTM